MRIDAQQFPLGRRMRVMTGGAIGINAGHFFMGVNKFFLCQTVAFTTQLPHWFEQITSIRGAVRGMAGIAFTLFDRDMNRAFLETLFFLLMTGVTERGPGDTKALLNIRSMRVMTAGALTPGGRGMHIFRRNGRRQSIVAAEA